MTSVAVAVGGQPPPVAHRPDDLGQSARCRRPAPGAGSQTAMVSNRAVRPPGRGRVVPTPTSPSVVRPSATTFGAHPLIAAKSASTAQTASGVADTTRVRVRRSSTPRPRSSTSGSAQGAKGSTRFMPPMGHSWHPCCQYLLRTPLAEDARWLRSEDMSEPSLVAADGRRARWDRNREAVVDAVYEPLTDGVASPGPSRSLSGRACRCRRSSATSTGSTTCRSRRSRTTSRVDAEHFALPPPRLRLAL